MTSDDRPRPVAYITLGGAGSGKSTLSKHLSALTGAAYLDKDTLAGPLVRVALEAYGQDPSDRESNAMYLEKVMPAEYETLFAAAGRNLELGHSVVIDAPFVAYLEDEDFLRRSTENARWPDVRIVVITVQTSPDVVRQRLLDRGSDRDRVKLAEWDTYWARFGALRCCWTTGEHIAFTNNDESDLARLSDLVLDH
ncbi:AAA family ATPase [Microbacterium sp. NPDC058062]|uniref:AAA family ATPase n=1 Tax=Microbacterium sp. NPDC058062 TaxID=3346320 RepID=UPI0036DCCB7D